MPPANKRRVKPSQPAGRTLGERITAFTAEVPYHLGKPGLVSYIGDNDDNAMLLLVAFHRADLGRMNRNVLPDSLLPYEAERDRNGAIVRFRDDTQSYGGQALAKILALDAVLMLDSRASFIEFSEGNFRGLIIPNRAVVIPPSADSPTTRVVSAVRCVTTKLTPQDVRELVSNPFVTLAELPRLLGALNKCKGEDATFSIPADFATVTTLQASIQQYTADASKRALAEGLLAAAVAASSYDERVAHFVTAPSSTFAASLGLKLHHEQGVLNFHTGQQIQAVRLADLEDDVEILLSAIPLDQRRYRLVTSLDGISVYPAAAKPGVRVKGHMRQVTSVVAVRKATYLRQLEAIVQSNSLPETAVAASHVSGGMEVPEGVEAVEDLDL